MKKLELENLPNIFFRNEQSSTNMREKTSVKPFFQVAIYYLPRLQFMNYWLVSP